MFTKLWCGNSHFFSEKPPYLLERGVISLSAPVYFYLFTKYLLSTHSARQNTWLFRV